MPSATSTSDMPRVVPVLPWMRVAMLALLSTLVGQARWEWQMRAVGLRSADIGDGAAQWAAERRKVDTGPRDAIVIVGDSRSLIDTRLEVWQELLGRKPIQLATADSSGLPVLEDLADSPHFAGLVVFGISDIDVFSGALRPAADFEFYRQRVSLAQRIDHGFKLQLSRTLAFIDSRHGLFNLLGNLPLTDRAGVMPNSPRSVGTWKLSETFADRQTAIWRQTEGDPETLAAFRSVWANAPAAPISDAEVEAAIVKIRSAVERIRSRGGDVVMLRPPSAAKVLEGEQRAVPRQRGWDRLVRETAVVGIHFADYEDMQELALPEWSHLSPSAAGLYTRAYVGVLCRESAWLRAHVRACAEGVHRIAGNRYVKNTSQEIHTIPPDLKVIGKEHWLYSSDS